MLWTGPWDLSQITAGNQPYGVTILPGDVNHQTISGPDNWVVFNNGSTRTKAAETFLTWLTAPAQVKSFSLATGDLPTRASIGNDPSVVDQMNQKLPGLKTFVENLSNVKQARPQVTSYPKISEALGNAIVGVLLGKLTPQAALSQAATATNQALASG
jgi:multiple sugar transport system substrate-binding protein